MFITGPGGLDNGPGRRTFAAALRFALILVDEAMAAYFMNAAGSEIEIALPFRQTCAQASIAGRRHVMLA
jgi:hypothetical protein